MKTNNTEKLLKDGITYLIVLITIIGILFAINIGTDHNRIMKQNEQIIELLTNQQGCNHE